METNLAEIKKSRKIPLAWNDDMRLELQKNLEKYGKQSGSEGGYKTQTWNAVLVAMQIAFPHINMDKDQLHSQHQSMKAKYNAYRKLKENVGTSGWGYDPETDMITTSNQVWDSYLSNLPDAKAHYFSHYPSSLDGPGKHTAPQTPSGILNEQF